MLTTNQSGWNEPTGVVRPTRPCPQGARCSCWQAQSAPCRGNARLSGVSIWLADWLSCLLPERNTEWRGGGGGEKEEEVCVWSSAGNTSSTSRFHLHVDLSVLFILYDERLGKTSWRWLLLVTGDTLKHSLWWDPKSPQRLHVISDWRRRKAVSFVPELVKIQSLSARPPPQVSESTKHSWSFTTKQRFY